MRVSLANSLRNFILFLSVALKPGKIFVPETDFDLFLYFCNFLANVQISYDASREVGGAQTVRVSSYGG